MFNVGSLEHESNTFEIILTMAAKSIRTLYLLLHLFENQDKIT